MQKSEQLIVAIQKVIYMGRKLKFRLNSLNKIEEDDSLDMVIWECPRNVKKKERRNRLPIDDWNTL